MGDLMFNRAHPVIDRVNGASIANWIGVLETRREGAARRHDLHLRPRRPEVRRSPAAAPTCSTTPIT
jgi:hypothetical protein